MHGSLHRLFLIVLKPMHCGSNLSFRYVVDKAIKESEAEDPMIHISHEVWIPEKLK